MYPCRNPDSRVPVSLGGLPAVLVVLGGPTIEAHYVSLRVDMNPPHGVGQCVQHSSV